MLETGITGKKELIVTKELTAAAAGSGLAEVFATPMMIALMEGTAAESVQPYLEEGQSTVGTQVNVKHLAASPVGMKITCETKLVEVDRKRLVFEVRAWDDAELIGEGTHERFIINSEKFFAKAMGKAPKAQ